jgi:hypothetical protein
MSHDNEHPLTLQTVREYAHAEVQRMGPDFTYNPRGPGTRIPACLYVPLTDPRADRYIRNQVAIAAGAEHTGCIVGSIIERAGLMTDRIAYGQLSAHAIIARGDLPLLEHDRKLITKYLATLQHAQDTGGTWGEAYEQAEATLEDKDTVPVTAPDETLDRAAEGPHGSIPGSF